MSWPFVIGGGALVVLILGVGFVFVACFQKVEHGTALIRNGLRGTKVSFTGLIILPVIDKMEHMDISVKRIEIDRVGENGLICKDNMRADVKVAFFVRVNKAEQDVLNVAQSLGCVRASDPRALIDFFDAKFSEALKTVGKQFDYVELYTNRLEFKEQIIKVIGRDLNGYILDDAAIDYLEQTPVSLLKAENILDAEGIKKITDLTAAQAILSNDITRNKEKTIKKQDVEAREAILALERQQTEAEEKQAREISEIQSRERAAAVTVSEAERKRAEDARIATDESIAVREENKQRQVIVACKNKEKTEAVESERVEKDRNLERVEREKVVTLQEIEKEKAVEMEKRNIQEVIRERVTVERTVVEQQEKIKDTEAFATADRAKQVAVTKATEEAEQKLIKDSKAAEASKEAARHASEQVIIEAEAQRTASEKEADARKIIADAKAQEEAVVGMGEARALEAKAAATRTFGLAEAEVVEKKAIAEATGIEKKSLAEAEGIRANATADAEGITKKAEAMKLFDGVGREHEEFKIKLQQELQIELAHVEAQKSIAHDQALVLGNAFKTAKIDIVGGEATFFDRVSNAITGAKVVDRYVDGSDTIRDIKETFFAGGPEDFKTNLQDFVGKFGVSTEDIKNLSIAAALTKLSGMTQNEDLLKTLGGLGSAAKNAGLSGKTIGDILG